MGYVLSLMDLLQQSVDGLKSRPWKSWRIHWQIKRL
ncbi:hypothetical protein LINPERHAP2_LOCUS41897 [Linum perenne]